MIYHCFCPAAQTRIARTSPVKESRSGASLVLSDADARLVADGSALLLSNGRSRPSSGGLIFMIGVPCVYPVDHVAGVC